jgi:hypothetical protein
MRMRVSRTILKRNQKLVWNTRKPEIVKFLFPLNHESTYLFRFWRNRGAPRRFFQLAVNCRLYSFVSIFWLSSFVSSSSIIALVVGCDPSSDLMTVKDSTCSTTSLLSKTIDASWAISTRRRRRRHSVSNQFFV